MFTTKIKYQRFAVLLAIARLKRTSTIETYNQRQDEADKALILACQNDGLLKVVPCRLRTVQDNISRKPLIHETRTLSQIKKGMIVSVNQICREGGL